MDEIFRFDQLKDYGQRVANELLSKDFILWLSGPLGAGKTTLVGEILRGMGLPQKIPVTSPTYTMMFEYQIKEHWYAHLDLYRAESDSELEEMGVLDAKDYRGIFIEWPQNIGDPTDIKPTHKIAIKTTGKDFRSYRFEILK